jgi:hypothetical protein
VERPWQSAGVKLCPMLRLAGACLVPKPLAGKARPRGLRSGLLTRVSRTGARCGGTVKAGFPAGAGPELPRGQRRGSGDEQRVVMPVRHYLGRARKLTMWWCRCSRRRCVQPPLSGVLLSIW